ncbi:MAG: hypothetical protein ACP5UV_05985, partial [Thermoplasmata archaeon]
FEETSWQLHSEANKILNAKGLGVPDISAIANNTIVYITENGTSYYANPNFFLFGGTSVASPVEAGIIAEIDAVLNHYNQSNLGYLNPLIYSMANKQVAPARTTSDTGFMPTGSYNSTLPALPFYNVMYGRNHVYNATYGYNLVTGWGSIDAYNLSMYILNINRDLSPNGLKGVNDVLNLTGLNVTSYLYNSTTGRYSTVNRYYNASIQQNLFLANQFGAPVYWIQNVIYINGSQKTGWAVNYTGWVVYPFYGQYPNQTVYEYNFPPGKTVSMPHTFNVRTWITNLSDPMQQTVNFEVNSHTVTLPVPGAAYIIDAYNYSYAWQGHTYYNGPFPDNRYDGGLNPQFGLVGGPSGGLGIFEKPTAGSVSSYIEPMDMNRYIPAITSVFNESIDETGETAYFLNFTDLSENSWAMSMNNDSLSQGIVDYPAATFTQTFHESGLPTGTEWGILVDGTEYSSTSDDINMSLINGVYTSIAESPDGYFATPSKYIFIVNGSNGTFDVIYASSFNETYLKAVATIYPVIGQTFRGSVFNTSYTGSSFNSSRYGPSWGIAYDNSSGLLFIPEQSINDDGSYVYNMYVYNTTTGRFIKIIHIPFYDAVYDPANGFVYAISVTGNVSEIDPSTFEILKNVSVPGSENIATLLQQEGNYIYALGLTGNISQIDTSSMTVTVTIRIGSVDTSTLFDGISPYFIVYGETAYVANVTGDCLMIVNFST